MIVNKKIIAEYNHYIDSLTKLVIKNGNINAFNMVHMLYAEKLKDQDILYLSILMAHKYNYNYGYFSVYTTLVNQKDYGLKELDEQTQNMALYYLVRSYELGYKDALYQIEEDLGEKVPTHKSSYYLDKMAQYDNDK
jgi:hypothetical protein